MRISIITVCFNGAATIRDTIESVLSQKTAGNDSSIAIDYIVMDGGSSDGTVEILKETERHLAEEPRAEISFRWVSQKDSGMYDALNKGIQWAQGEVVGLLNSDDVLAADDTLLKIAAAWAEMARCGKRLDASYGDVRFVRAAEKGVAALRNEPTVRYCSGKYFHPWQFRFGVQVAHPSFFCRKECFEKFGYYSLDFGMYGDFELLLRFLWKNHIQAQYVPICTTIMRMGGASTNGWQSMLKINASDLRAIRANGYWSVLPLIYLKYFCKVWGFVFKKRR